MTVYVALRQIGTPRILVVGDLILDRYTWGDAKRISPEAPVPVLCADEEEIRLGGAGSVAALLRGLDANVCVAGLIGDDRAGRTVLKLLDENSINCEGVLIDTTRRTTEKERLVGRASGRHPHQMIRVDREDRHAPGEDLEERLARAILRELERCQAILISDYAKGVCTPRLLSRILAGAADHEIPVIIDPARIDDYERYRGATLLTPNRDEAERATGFRICMPSDALAAGRILCERLELQATLVTLDRDGIALVTSNGHEQLYAAKPRNVYDVTGAGDMVLAMVGLCQAAGVALPETIDLANVAAGLEVEQLGVAVISRKRIHGELVDRQSSPCQKLVSSEEMATIADACRRNGKSLVFTNGCFDLLHPGHVAFLQEASSLGDVLLVAVNSDRSVAALKGDDRPIVGEMDRLGMLASLHCVTHVLLLDEPTPCRLLRNLRPDVIVKGGTTEEIVGREIVESYGGNACRLSSYGGHSTTTIISKILKTQELVVPAEAQP